MARVGMARITTGVGTRGAIRTVAGAARFRGAAVPFRPTYQLEQPPGIGTTPVEVRTERGDKVTAVFHDGWVGTEKGVRVYDPQAYSAMMGHTPGYYGFERYGGTRGQEPIKPEDFEKWPQRAQYDWERKHGIIPSKAEFIPGRPPYFPQIDVLRRPTAAWSYLPTTKFAAGKEYELPEISKLKREDPKLWSTLTTRGWDAYERAVEAKQKRYERERIARERQILEFEDYQRKLVSGEIILIRGEPVYAKDFNELPDRYQAYARGHGIDALSRLIEQGLEPPVTSGDLDRIVKEGNVLERSYVNEAIMRAGFLNRITGFRTKNWADLTSDEKKMVVDKYKTPAGQLAKVRQALTGWAKPEQVPVTAGQVDEAVRDFGIVGGKRALAAGIARAMKESGVVPEKPKMEKLAEEWGALSKGEKEKVIENYRTFSQRFEETIDKPVSQALENMTEWATDDPSEAMRLAKGVPVGLAQLAIGLVAGVGGSVVKGFGDLVEARPKSAGVQLANVPVGMADWAFAEAPNRIAQDPYSGVALLIGNLALPFFVKGVVGGVGTAYRAGTTLAKGGILPRAFKTGGTDIFRVRVPEGFERLTSELDVIARDQAKVKAVFESGLSRPQQVGRVRELLNPETRVVYDNYLKLIDEASRFEVPQSMVRGVDFADIARMPERSAEAVKAWFEKNAKDVKVYGSFADWVQTKGIKGMWKPNDLDLNVMPKGKLTPESAATELAGIIRRTSGETVRARGGKVEIYREGEWIKVADIHFEGEFGKLPYEWSPKKPVTIDGIPFERLGEQMFRRGEQIVNPGVGMARGLMGPEAAKRPWRLKDIYRFETEIQGIIGVLREQGKKGKAGEFQSLLAAVRQSPRGKPLPISAEKAAALQREFIELVDELQSAALVRGVDVSLGHRLGTLVRYIAPAGRLVKGTVYHATRDVRPYVRALREGRPIEVGKLITEAGRRAEAPSQLFTSPDLAFDRLYDMFKGKIPDEAGVIAIRTIGGDVGKGRQIKPAFRVEYDFVKGEAYPVVLDELVLAEGARVYATSPTGLSLRKGSASQGLTGESLTYHPRAKKPVAVLWLATERAQKAGLRAPSMAQSRALNLMAFKATLGDLLHPHLPKRVVVTTEARLKGGSLIEFYRDTYKWKGKPKVEINEMVAKESKALTDKALKAVERRRAKGEKIETPEEYAKALAQELDKAAAKEILGVLSDKEIQRLFVEVTTDALRDTFVINLRGLTSAVATAGLGLAGTKTMSQLREADITALPTLAAQIAPSLPKPRTRIQFEALPLTPPTAVTSIKGVKPITPTVTTLTGVTPTTSKTAIITTLTGITPMTPTTPTFGRFVTTKRIWPLTPPPPPPPRVRLLIPSPLPPLRLVKARVKEKVGERLEPIAWRQGQLLQRGKLEPVWHVIKPPFRGKKDVEHFVGELPEWVHDVKPGLRSALRSIQAKGKSIKDLVVDLGIMDLYIKSPKRTPGLAGALTYKLDPKQKTISDITIGGLRGEKEGAKSKLPYGTTLESALVYRPKSKALSEFRERDIVERMSKLTPSQIADALTKSRITKAERDALLKRLPDRERKQTEMWLSERSEYAPTRGYPKALMQPKKLRRGGRRGKVYRKPTVGLTEVKL